MNVVIGLMLIVNIGLLAYFLWQLTEDLWEGGDKDETETTSREG